MGRQLWDAIARLEPLQPKFVSVTYGADGSTRARTHECVMRLLRETDLCVAPHLTCIGASAAEVTGIAEDYWRTASGTSWRCAAICRTGWAPAPGMRTPRSRMPPISCGSRRHRALRHFGGRVSGGSSGVGRRGGRRGQPEAQDRCGRRRAITQFFFDTDAYLRYRDRCRAAESTSTSCPDPSITRFPSCGALPTVAAPASRMAQPALRRPGR